MRMDRVVLILYQKRKDFSFFYLAFFVPPQYIITFQILLQSVYIVLCYAKAVRQALKSQRTHPRNAWLRGCWYACVASPGCCVSVWAKHPHWGGWSRRAAPWPPPPSLPSGPSSSSSSPRERKGRHWREGPRCFWRRDGPPTVPHPQLRYEERHTVSVISSSTGGQDKKISIPSLSLWSMVLLSAELSTSTFSSSSLWLWSNSRSMLISSLAASSTSELLVLRTWACLMHRSWTQTDIWHEL